MSKEGLTANELREELHGLLNELVRAWSSVDGHALDPDVTGAAMLMEFVLEAIASRDVSESAMVKLMFRALYEENARRGGTVMLEYYQAAALAAVDFLERAPEFALEDAHRTPAPGVH